jgi:hypothetical protein
VLPGGTTTVTEDTGCERSTYSLKGERQPGSGPGSGLYISPGDGPNPAGATDAEFRDRIVAALEELTTATGCGYTSDLVNIDYWVNPQTSYETDFKVNSNGNHVCAGFYDTDGVSTIDAGNIDKAGTDPIAVACTWSAVPNGSIVESDIRFNVDDYDWTLRPAGDSCDRDRRYDVRMVLTHELGHSYGMRDLGPTSAAGSASDKYLTMYEAGFVCRSWGRSLGKGDILGMRAMY